MTQCKILPQDFIKEIFTPQIGVLCSSAADESCKKNNLSFIELLQPFCKLNSDVQYKDPSGTVVTVKNLRISLVDVNSKPPHPTIARKHLNSSVSFSLTPKYDSMTIADYHLSIPSNAPWFEAWREIFFQVQYPADHEFTQHFLACMLVICSNDVNPLGEMAQLVMNLNQMQNISVSKLPKWFTNNVLKYYVLIHEEVGSENAKISELFTAMKTTYGVNNCFLLKMNSRIPSSMGHTEYLPDPWSQFIKNRFSSFDQNCVTPESSPSLTSVLTHNLELAQEVNETETTLTYHPLSPDTEEIMGAEIMKMESEDDLLKPPVLHGYFLSTEDIEQLKLLMHDFCIRSLVPFVEKQISNLHELISYRKNVSKSLFSATKRWFTPNKPTSNSATINTLTYPPDAPELHIRRLGDLYFMFGHYTAAYQAYHQAKRDFMADQAWLYCAGALEMAALSAFMGNETSKKTFDYMEESIITYLNTCKMAQFATRATLLSTECLKSHGMYGEAAHQFIRMTSEESDLRSALLLEQAAYCFLLCTRPKMVRKYAFHMVLAGHRFCKSSQRHHSLRCYKQAYQVYENKGWNLAQDHIYYTIARQANNLGLYEEAVASYSKLLTDKSKQSATQQSLYLKEYLAIHSILLRQQNLSLVQFLPIPIIHTDTIKVLVGPTAPLRTPGKIPALGISLSSEEDPVPINKWNKLEEILVQEAQGSLPMVFKPLVTLFTGESSIPSKPIAIVGEPIQVSIQLYNPLHILLNLKDIYLLWQFTDRTNNCVTNDDENYVLDNTVKTHYIKSVVLQSNMTQEVTLNITPLSIGNISLKGICFNLVSSSGSNPEKDIELKGKQIFEIRNGFKSEKHLQIAIVPSAPCLQVSFSETNMELLRNELQPISIELRNVGSVNLHKIHMATSKPNLISSCEFQPVTDDQYLLNKHDSISAREYRAKKNHVSVLPLPNGMLEPGQYHNVTIWMKAPEVTGPSVIDLLIYYENVERNAIPRYRLVRHLWQLTIHESVKIEVISQQSTNTKTVEELGITLRTTNLNKPHHAILIEISILKVCLLSDYWVLSSYKGIENNMRLKTQETAVIYLHAYRNVSHKSNYSDFKLNSVENGVVPEMENAAYLDFARRNEQNNLNLLETNQTVEELEKDQKQNNGTIVVIWQAYVTDSIGRNRTVRGLSQVSMELVPLEAQGAEDYDGRSYALSDPYNSPKYVDNKLSINYDERLVTFNFFYTPVMTHDFRRRKLCIIPIKFVIHNNVDCRLDLRIQTLGTSSESNSSLLRPNLFYPFSSNDFRWISPGSYVKELDPFCSITIGLSVAVLSIGTYDLGSRIEVFCRDISRFNNFILQACRAQSSIIVRNGNG